MALSMKEINFMKAKFFHKGAAHKSTYMDDA